MSPLAIDLVQAAAVPSPAPDTGDVRARMLQLAALLYAGEPLTARFIHERFGVSWATAKRDLVVIEQNLPVRCRMRPGNGFIPGEKRLTLQP